MLDTVGQLTEFVGKVKVKFYSTNHRRKYRRATDFCQVLLVQKSILSTKNLSFLGIKHKYGIIVIEKEKTISLYIIIIF